MTGKWRVGLTEPQRGYDEAKEVRRMLAAASTKAAVRERFGICRSTAKGIPRWAHRAWSWGAAPVPSGPQPFARRRRTVCRIPPFL